MPPATGLRAHIELIRISTQITSSLYRVPATGDTIEGIVAGCDNALLMIERWKSNLLPTLQLSPDGLSNDPATCTLHMFANQLIIVAIRPSLFTYTKSHFTQTSPSSSPAPKRQYPHWDTCINAALRNMRLSRHLATLHRPRRLLHTALHHVFNAALCFLLQSLVMDSSDMDTSREVEFAIELFDREAQTGNTYGLRCSNTLRQLQMLIARRQQDSTASMEIDTEQMFEGISTDTLWQSQGFDLTQVQGNTEEESSGTLHDDVLSWMDQDWLQNMPL